MLANTKDCGERAEDPPLEFCEAYCYFSVALVSCTVREYVHRPRISEVPKSNKRRYKMAFTMDDLLSATGLTSPLLAGTIGVIVLINVVFRVSRSFKRDGVGNSFGGMFTGSVSLLSNPDSLIKREEVKDEMDGYDSMFTGARKNVGSLHEKESIEKRQKEYHTMVNSFYNLVTDFYEYGWGQVRGIHHCSNEDDQVVGSFRAHCLYRAQ